MASEVKSLLPNRTWEIVKRPKEHSVIGSRFVLQNKYSTNGILENRKARVVARVFRNSREGIFKKRMQYRD